MAEEAEQGHIRASRRSRRRHGCGVVELLRDGFAAVAVLSYQDLVLPGQAGARRARTWVGGWGRGVPGPDNLAVGEVGGAAGGLPEQARPISPVAVDALPEAGGIAEEVQAGHAVSELEGQAGVGVILQVLADVGAVELGVDADGPGQVGAADAGGLQQLGRLRDAGAGDDLSPGLDEVVGGAAGEVDGRGRERVAWAVAVGEDDAVDQGAGEHMEVGPVVGGGGVAARDVLPILRDQGAVASRGLAAVEIAVDREVQVAKSLAPTDAERSVAGRVGRLNGTLVAVVSRIHVVDPEVLRLLRRSGRKRLRLEEVEGRAVPVPSVVAELSPSVEIVSRRMVPIPVTERARAAQLTASRPGQPSVIHLRLLPCCFLMVA